jgi:hypothetical protein
VLADTADQEVGVCERVEPSGDAFELIVRERRNERNGGLSE